LLRISTRILLRAKNSPVRVGRMTSTRRPDSAVNNLRWARSSPPRSTEPAVNLQVVPYAAGGHYALLGAFDIVESPPSRGAAHGGVRYRPIRNAVPLCLAGLHQAMRGDLASAQWRKTSYSGGNGGSCVEVARNLSGVAASIAGIRAGEFD
jgi:Domain of unknown function (DUF397)